MSFRPIFQIFGVESESDSFPLQTKFIGLELKVDQGFYPSTFAYSRFPRKIQFFYSLLSLLSPWDIPTVDSEERSFGIRASRLPTDYRSMAFTLLINMIFGSEYQLRITPFCHVCLYIFLSALAAIGSFEEKSTRKIHATCLYPCL